MLKEIKITTATIEMDGFKLEVSGQLDEWAKWTTTLSFPNSPIYIRDKVYDLGEQWISEDELDKFAWDELLSILQKYNHFSVDEKTEEIEVDDDEEDE